MRPNKKKKEDIDNHFGLLSIGKHKRGMSVQFRHPSSLLIFQTIVFLFLYSSPSNRYTVLIINAISYSPPHSFHYYMLYGVSVKMQNVTENIYFLRNFLHKTFVFLNK